MFAYAQAEKKSKTALASIIISAMTTSFVGTSFSFDFDTAPHRRNNNPNYYGYILNDPTSRMFTFLAMFAITLTHVLMKTLATALLMIVNSSWLLMMMVGDISIFMFMKIVRRDIRWWIRLDGALGLIVSVLIRFVEKLLVDFTCCFHYRHP